MQEPHGPWKQQAPKPLTSRPYLDLDGAPATGQADHLLRVPDRGPVEAEPQKAPRQTPLDTQREPRGPAQRADEVEAVQRERPPPRAPQPSGGSAPRADVAERGGWGRDACALTGAPSTPAPQPRRGGRAPGQLGRGGPPPAPQTPARCEHWTPAEELAGGGRRWTVNSKDQAERTSPLCGPPPTRAQLPGSGPAPGKGTVPEQTAPGAVEPSLQTLWLPAT